MEAFLFVGCNREGSPASTPGNTGGPSSRAPVAGIVDDTAVVVGPDTLVLDHLGQSRLAIDEVLVGVQRNKANKSQDPNAGIWPESEVPHKHATGNEHPSTNFIVLRPTLLFSITALGALTPPSPTSPGCVVCPHQCRAPARCGTPAVATPPRAGSATAGHSVPATGSHANHRPT
jgi:hypothetical protein